MSDRDHPCGPSGRREAADDAVHRQGFPTPPGVAEAPPAINKRGHSVAPGVAEAPPAINKRGHPVAPDGPHGRLERRLAKAIGQGGGQGGGQCRTRLAMPRIATPRAPSRKPWQAVPMSRYHRSLV